MPSTSDFSDVALDRIARSESYYGRYDPVASSPIVGANDKDLRHIGSLFQPNHKQGSWPQDIEIIEDEGTSQSSNVASKHTEVTQHPPSTHNDSLPLSPPPTPRHTPPRAAGYVSPREYLEFQRQRSSNHKALRRSDQSSDGSPTPPPGRSPCTTVYGGDDDRVPDRQGPPRTPVSNCHTPSQRSFCTTEDGTGRIGEPTSPSPWSSYDQKCSNNKDGKKE